MSAPFKTPVKGWCPGALRPMPAGDGLLLRLRPKGSAVSIDAARAIAAVAAHCGNGGIELSMRGNLQLRGFAPETLPEALAQLARHGLLDATAEAEARRNILISPLAGLTTAPDIRPLEEKLGSALAEARDLAALPGKFGFLIDDCSAPSLAACPADIRFDYDTDTGLFSIGIGGDATEAIRLGTCTTDALVPLALGLARAFLRLAALPDAGQAGRMRGLIDHYGPARILHLLRLGEGAPVPYVATDLRASVTPPVGRFDLTPSAPSRASACLAAGLPFGRCDAAMLAGLAEAAERAGASDIRLTPWRLVFLTGLEPARRDHLAEELTDLGFILDPADPRLRIAACSGAPACAEASTPVQDDAQALSALLLHRRASAGAPGIFLHVSGCAKGCAHAAPAPLTLVARAGLYDLVLEGKATDHPAARGLTLTQVESLLARSFSPETGASS
ncbi:precorrin-3B synthase [Beijerinckia mobilis]|uniref:precorrin-3B synthase n=1 Tax=Beijerinckia mobilis TaxID=231434 RepID=UPI0005596E46|nr:precorrin-3B synthase [Beijerinckia mobilis]